MMDLPAKDRGTTRNVGGTRGYYVTITRYIRHATDPDDAQRAAEQGAGDLVDVEVAESPEPQ